jgi:hypothetical protein
MMWDQAWEHIQSRLSDGPSMINSETFLELMDSIVTAYNEPLNDPTVWLVRVDRYNQLRWYAHCAKVYREPSRKLRKCEMRRMAKRRASERKRYI